MPGVGAYLWLRDRNGVADKKKWELLYDPKNWSYDLLLVISIPGSCVQAFKQYKVAGHVSDALAVVGVPIEVAELVTPAGVVTEPSEVAGQDVEFPDDGIMDFGSPFVNRPFFFRFHHLPLGAYGSVFDRAGQKIVI